MKESNNYVSSIYQSAIVSQLIGCRQTDMLMMRLKIKVAMQRYQGQLPAWPMSKEKPDCNK